MVREMRRKDRMLDDAETRRLLDTAEYGVFCLSGDEGYPYGVPLNYVVEGDYVYAHGFMDGHKMDAVKNSPKASLTVVFADDVEVMKDQIATNYTSIIAFGKVDLIPMEEEVERMRIMQLIGGRFIPGEPARTDAYIEKNKANTNLIRFHIEQLSGKQRNVR